MAKRKKREYIESSQCGGGEDECTTPVKKKLKVESRRRRPGITQEIYNETSYHVKNGLRYVKPYYFTFSTHAKGRWVGSKVIDVFCKEFQSETPEYYEKAVKAGKVTVNGVVATMETVVRENELVTHKVHRHEPPVIATPLNIVHKDEDLIVLDKPASIPVHPCGRYRHNSLVFLLAKEHKLLNLHTVHRLDRLTSGLLMFARSVSKAQQMETQIRERRVSKVYLCRVQGEFPSETVVCSEPILVVTHKVGVCMVDPQGKDCYTTFTRLSFNGKTTVVQCEPKTGRMHQIRVHLQWLGHPIVNDPIYNHPAWRQPPDSLGTGNQTNIERIISEIVRTNYSSEAPERATQTEMSSAEDTVESHSVQKCKVSVTDLEISRDGQITRFSHNQQGSASGASLNSARDAEGSTNESVAVDDGGDNEATEEQTDTEASVAPTSTCAAVGGTQTDSSVDADCSECHMFRPDPSPSDLLMYLHALSYKGEGWEFSTSTPEWAHPDWTEDER